MRIAMIGQKGFPPAHGGIERHVADLSTSLAKNGHQVIVYARKYYTPVILNTQTGVLVMHTWGISTKHLDAITHSFTALFHALRTKVDVIHFHGVGPALLSFIPRLFSPHTRVITTFHGIDRYHQKWGFIARLALHLGEVAACTFAHQTISVSKTIHNYCLNEYGKNTSYIPNSLPTPKCSTANDVLETWGLENKKYVLAASRLVGNKGIHYLIEAWKRAERLYPSIMQNYKLVIAGGSTFTDNYVDELHTQAKNSPRIIFTDWQSGNEMAALFDHALLLVQPSEFEGLSLAILEAMARGIAVLISDIPENKELINNPNFWFFNTNVSSLGSRLAGLLAQPDMLIEAGQANKITAESNYAWEKMVTATEETYLSFSTQENIIPATLQTHYPLYIFLLLRYFNMF